MYKFIYIYLHIYICMNNDSIKLRENTNRTVSAISIFENSSGTTFVCRVFLKHYISVVGMHDPT